eukprot:m.501720 g.501720  ORF g.501720 m.501720 type:complete len:103 (+) comp21840_c1_seq5:942-1250(+)
MAGTVFARGTVSICMHFVALRTDSMCMLFVALIKNPHYLPHIRPELLVIHGNKTVVKDLTILDEKRRRTIDRVGAHVRYFQKTIAGGTVVREQVPQVTGNCH